MTLYLPKGFHSGARPQLVYTLNLVHLVTLLGELVRERYPFLGACDLDPRQETGLGVPRAGL